MQAQSLTALALMLLSCTILGCQSKNDEKNLAPVNNTSTPTQVTTTIQTPQSPTSQQPTTLINIAAAQSLQPVMPILVNDFTRQHPEIQIKVDYNAAGKLYDEIVNKPVKYDIYLSANQVFTQKLYENGHTQGYKYGKPFTYTQGQLVLYSTKHPIEATPTSTLSDYSLDHPNFVLAIADPLIAPYGNAAQVWLVNQNLLSIVSGNIGVKTSIDEAFSAADSGQADFGFVALSQVLSKNQDNSLSSYSNTINYAILPRDSYPPIVQDGIVLKQTPASQAFAAYLLTAKAQDIFTSTGFLPVCTTTTLLPACKTAPTP